MALAKGQIIFRGVHVDASGAVVEPAVYSVNWPALADGNTFPGQFQIDANYHFVLHDTIHVVPGAVAGSHVNAQIQVQEQNGRPWFIQPVYINAVSALQDSGRPSVPSVKRRMKNTAIVQVTIYDATNL